MPPIRARAAVPWLALVVAAAAIVAWRVHQQRESRHAAPGRAVEASDARAAVLRGAPVPEERRAVAETAATETEVPQVDGEPVHAAPSRLVRVRSSLGVVPLDARVRRGDVVDALEGERDADHLAVLVPEDATEIAALAHAWRALPADATDVVLDPLASIVLFGTDLDSRIEHIEAGVDQFGPDAAGGRLNGECGQFARVRPDERVLALDADAIPAGFDPYSVMVLFESGEWLDVQPDLVRRAHWRIDLDALVPPESPQPARGELVVALPDGRVPTGELDVEVRARRVPPRGNERNWRRIETGDDALRVQSADHAPVDITAATTLTDDGWRVTWFARPEHTAIVTALAADSGCFGAAFVQPGAERGRLVLREPVHVRVLATPSRIAPPEWHVGAALEGPADGLSLSRTLAHSEWAVPTDGVERVYRVPRHVGDVWWMRAARHAPDPGAEVALVELSATADERPRQAFAVVPERTADGWSAAFSITLDPLDGPLSGEIAFHGGIPANLEVPGRGRLTAFTSAGLAEFDVMHAESGEDGSLRLTFDEQFAGRPARGELLDAEAPHQTIELQAFADLPAHVAWQPTWQRVYLCTHDSGRLQIVDVEDIRAMELPIDRPLGRRDLLRAVWRIGDWGGRGGAPFWDRRTPLVVRNLHVPDGADVTVHTHDFHREAQGFSRRIVLRLPASAR